MEAVVTGDPAFPLHTNEVSSPTATFGSSAVSIALRTILVFGQTVESVPAIHSTLFMFVILISGLTFGEMTTELSTLHPFSDAENLKVESFFNPSLDSQEKLFSELSGHV